MYPLAELFHHLLQHFPARPHHRFRQGGQRLVGHIQQIDEVRRFGVDIEHSGQHFAFFVRSIQAANGCDAVGRIVILFQLAEAQMRAVVHGDLAVVPGS